MEPRFLVPRPEFWDDKVEDCELMDTCDTDIDSVSLSPSSPGVNIQNNENNWVVESPLVRHTVQLKIFVSMYAGLCKYILGLNFIIIFMGI